MGATDGGGGGTELGDTGCGATLGGGGGSEVAGGLDWPGFWVTVPVTWTPQPETRSDAPINAKNAERTPWPRDHPVVFCILYTFRILSKDRQGSSYR